MNRRDLDKAAERGEPSYVWREGQERRFAFIREAAGCRITGRLLENGCGVGVYLERLAMLGGSATGLEFELERAREARRRAGAVVNAAGEELPFSSASFDLILSHEVIEHVRDDRRAIGEMIRCLRPGGRLVLFCPNRGYPFETHGIYWGGRYRFGNIPLINYLPRRWRDRLAPHVRVYTTAALRRLFEGLPVRFVTRTIIFGAYDNLIQRFGVFGRWLRAALHWLEHTPMRILGLSHYWVMEVTRSTDKPAAPGTAHVRGTARS